jgi:hypothetical protein
MLGWGMLCEVQRGFFQQKKKKNFGCAEEKIITKNKNFRTKKRHRFCKC